jgi:hypothetical protein
MVPNGLSLSTPTNFIQLPAYVGYKYNVISKLDVLLGIGPYVAYGISGRNIFKEKISASDLFNFGMATMTGVQWNNKIQLSAGYDLNLDRQKSELEKERGNYYTFKNSISLFYLN